MTVKILKIQRGVDVFRWLCGPCADKLITEGWAVIGKKTPPHPLRCDRCGVDDAKPVEKREVS